MLLVSVFAAGAVAKRVAAKHDIAKMTGQLQKEVVANGPGILPVHLALPVRPAVMPRASMPVGMAMPEGYIRIKEELEQIAKLQKDSIAKLLIGRIAKLEGLLGRMNADDDQRVPPMTAERARALKDARALAAFMADAGALDGDMGSTNGIDGPDLGPAEQQRWNRFVESSLENLASLENEATKPEEAPAVAEDIPVTGLRKRLLVAEDITVTGPAVITVTGPAVGEEAVEGVEVVTNLTEGEAQQEKYRVNTRRAYNSLNNNIPQILQLGSEWTMDWDIYTDDLKTDFSNVVDSEPLRLFSAVAVKHVPSWTASIEGKDLNKVAFQELRVFIDNFVKKSLVTGQDWCMDKDAGLGPEPSTHEGDQVITSNWKMELTMMAPTLIEEDGLLKKVELTTPSEGIVTIEGLSRFHLNDDGKIYRHSILLKGYVKESLLKEMSYEEAKLFLENLAKAPRANSKS